jgi:SAM-dependent methyltransferase
MNIDPGFRGEIATYYARYRRGYPDAAVDAIADAFGLNADDVVLDLGCGTGQLSLPLAARAGTVIGMDPEPDMLRLAAVAADRQQITNTSWVRGSDRDVPALVGPALGAMTVAVAIHWMDRDALFRAGRPMLRAGGGVAVVTNGAPLWLQDTDWSRAARRALEELTGQPVTGACQTDEAGRRLTTAALESAGYRVASTTVGYDASLSVDQLVGGLFSALSADRLPAPERRAEFAARLATDRPMIEHVRVTLQFGWPR